jgi:pantoate--beta-alanine ligase
MKVLRTLTELNEFVAKNKQIRKKIGFVPTMGFLHAGHISLIDLSKSQTDITIASIYVNPSQFNDSKDYEKYPKNEAKDLELLKKGLCDAVFIPSQHEIETIKKNKSIDFGGLDKILESRFRPGHFRGVVEVVYRLFTAVNPDKAFFGEKDFQQLQIIKRMVDKLNLSVEIMGGLTVRESNGLAMSSRNSRLSKKARDRAGFIYRVLSTFTEYKRSYFEKELLELGFDLEYLEQHDFGDQKRLFIAGFYDEVRLIDNIQTN